MVACSAACRGHFLLALREVLDDAGGVERAGDLRRDLHMRAAVALGGVSERGRYELHRGAVVAGVDGHRLGLGPVGGVFPGGRDGDRVAVVHDGAVGRAEHRVGSVGLLHEQGVHCGAVGGAAGQVSVEGDVGLDGRGRGGGRRAAFLPETRVVGGDQGASRGEVLAGERVRGVGPVDDILLDAAVGAEAGGGRSHRGDDDGRHVDAGLRVLAGAGTHVGNGRGGAALGAVPVPDRCRGAVDGSIHPLVALRKLSRDRRGRGGDGGGVVGTLAKRERLVRGGGHRERNGRDDDRRDGEHREESLGDSGGGGVICHGCTSSLFGITRGQLLVVRNHLLVALVRLVED